MSITHLTIALTRDVPIEDATPQQRICIKLHTVHTALENEVRRMCASSMGDESPEYNLLIGECYHVSHDLPKIMRLHATKAQAGAIRNVILRLQDDGLWDLPEYAVVKHHEWIHR